MDTDAATGRAEDADPRGAHAAADAPGVASRWWYWIAAVPVYAVVTFFLAGLFFLFVVGTGMGGPGPMPVGPGVVFPLVVLLVLPGLVLAVMLPVAFYFDATAVAESAVDWDPDPVLYALVGVVGIFVNVVGPVAALYYLYRRHRRVGVP